MQPNHKSLIALLSVLLVALALLVMVGMSPEKMSVSLVMVNTQTVISKQTLTRLETTPFVTHITHTPLPSPTATITPLPTATITQTATATPSYEATEIIGFSVEGRPLEVYRFGNGEHAYMIVAGIHGGYEWNTVALADELIEALRSDPTLVPANRTLYLLRLLNPDGYAKDDGPDGRANANNVDLNRNWNANWQANWYGTHCWNYRFVTAGEKAGSEPETQALAGFLTKRKIEALISYHSAALGIFAGGWPNDKASLKLAYALSLISPYSYPPVEADCQYTGQLIDWASTQEIASVDVELTNHVDTDFEINMRILKAFLDYSKE